MAQKAHSLSHTKWMCKYHIVFTPKYRRKVIYNQYRSSLGEIFRRLCSYKGVEIIEGHLMPDHVHMLVSIPSRVANELIDKIVIHQPTGRGKNRQVTIELHYRFIGEL